MAKIKIIGESNEATILQSKDGETFRFECSRGTWCRRPGDVRDEDTMADVIEHAEMHVDLEDEASRVRWS